MNMLFAINRTTPYKISQTTAPNVINALIHAIVLAVVNQRRQQQVATLQSVAFFLAHTRASPTELHSRMLGAIFLSSIEGASHTIWNNLFRMSKSSFNALFEWLQGHTLLYSGRVSAREKLMIFLYIVCQGITHRIAAFLFGRSEETINR